MNNTIEIFTNRKFGEIRTLNIRGEPWFVAVDVCKALDISNNRMATERLDEDEIMTVSLTDSHSGQRGGAQMLNIVSESGLYSLILRSRKPEARAFKRWITHEVIPAIRKHGAYMTDSMLARVSREPEIVLEIAAALIAERQKNQELSYELGDARPKAEYYDSFVNPDETTCIRSTAKELNIPEKKFVRYLLDNGYVYRNKLGQLMPVASERNRELFLLRDFHWKGHKGEWILLTPAGKEHFRQLFSQLTIFKLC